MIYNKLTDATKDLLEGKVGIIPTDTVYGLVVIASDQNAVAKISKIKGRENKPGTIIAANIDQLVKLGFKRRYLTAVDYYWPRSISIIIPTGKTLEYLHHGLQSVAVRIPDDQKLIKLLDKTGPLMTSSANLTGEQPISNIAEAQLVFGEQIDFYVDGGDLSDRQASTLIQINDDAVEILREGSVKIDEETGRILNDI